MFKGSVEASIFFKNRKKEGCCKISVILPYLLGSHIPHFFFINPPKLGGEGVKSPSARYRIELKQGNQLVDNNVLTEHQFIILEE